MIFNKFTLSLLISLYFINSPVFAMNCWATRKEPQTSEKMLSNGKVFKLPARACNFSIRTLIASANLKNVQQALEPAGLYPITVSGKAILFVSFYLYNQTDMGSFAEFYIVTPASLNPHSGFTTISALWNALRANPNHKPSENLIFHHLYARSTDPDAALASREIWGIDSQLVKIEHQSLGKNTERLLYSEDGAKLVEWNIDRPSRGNSMTLPMNLHLYAGGFIEQIALSPVASKGRSRLQKINSFDKLPNFSESHLRRYLQELEWNPMFLQWGDNLQAIQYDRSL